MNVSTILKDFFKFDIPSLRCRVNNLTDSIWLYQEGEHDLIHLRFTLDRGNIVLRLYTESDDQYKITYQTKADNLRFSTLNDDSKVIDNFMEVTNLEEWFQRTTVDDLLGLEFDDFVNFRILFDAVVNIADKKLNG